jgi:anti-sigma B factor antagonist
VVDPGLIIERHESVSLVRFRDPSILDSLSIQRIGRSLQEVVEAPGVSGVVLDFTNVRFLASEALRVLLTLRSKAEKSRSRIALCCIRPELIRVFSLTNLDQMFKIFENSEAALEHARGER